MPSTPTLTVTPSTTDGRNVVVIANSDSPDSNRIERAAAGENGGAFIVIASGLSVGATFYDSNVAAGIPYSYRAVAIASGVEAVSTIEVATLTLTRLWMHAVQKDDASNVFGTAVSLINMATQEKDTSRESASFVLSGRETFKILASDIIGETVNVLCRIVDADYANKATLLEIQESGRYVCIRDQNYEGMLGFKIFGLLDVVPLQYQYGYTDFQLTLTGVQYNEAVS